MDLEFAEPPPSILPWLARFPASMDEAEGYPPDRVRLVADRTSVPAHNMFSIGPEALLAGALPREGPGGAEWYGWRQIAVSADSRVSRRAAIVRRLDEGEPDTLVEVNFGPFVGESEAVWRRLAEGGHALSGLQGRYEYRVLAAPSVYVVSVWLHRDDGLADRFVALRPYPQKGGFNHERGELVLELKEMRHWLMTLQKDQSDRDNRDVGGPDLGPDLPRGGKPKPKPEESPPEEVEWHVEKGGESADRTATP